MEQEPSFEQEKYQNWEAPETATADAPTPPDVQYVDGKRQVLQRQTARENGAYMYGEQPVTKTFEGKYLVPTGNSLRDPATGRASADELRELTPEETAQHLK